MAVVYSQNGAIVREVEQPAPDFIMNFRKIKGVYQSDGYNKTYSGLVYDTENNIYEAKFTITSIPDGQNFYVFRETRDNINLYVSKVPYENAVYIDGVRVSLKLNTPYVVRRNKSVLTIDGTDYSSGYNSGVYNEIYIGPTHNSTPYTYSGAYLEYITVLDRSTGKVLFDKRAASRDKDNQVGLLDVAAGGFFTTYLDGVR